MDSTALLPNLCHSGICARYKMGTRKIFTARTEERNLGGFYCTFKVALVACTPDVNLIRKDEIPDCESPFFLASERHVRKFFLLAFLCRLSTKFTAISVKGGSLEAVLLHIHSCMSL